MDNNITFSGSSNGSSPQRLASQISPSSSILTTPRSISSLDTPTRLHVDSRKDSTPKSSNSKTGWSVIHVKMQQKIQMHIMCKRSNGKIGPFSSAGSASKRRPMWEPIVKCDFKIEKKGTESKRLFQFKNVDNDTAVFRADLFNPLLVAVNPFTQKCTALLVSNPKLLASYLSLLSCSEKYVGHNSDTHDKNGFSKGVGFSGEESLVRLGGSESEYVEFVKSAVATAADVDGVGGKQSSIEKISPISKKRKVTDFFSPIEKKKLSKTEIIEENFRGMVTDDGGLEKSVVSAYLGIEALPLEQLHVSPDLFLPINQTKVNDLVESMSDRLEVSQLVVSVIPADLTKYDEDGTNEKYWVVHGIHRLEAMKKLDAMNKIKPIPGFPSKRSLICFILKVDSPSLTNYINIKCNDLASGFQSRASNEALLFVYKGLLQSTKDKVESLDIIEKICFSRHMGSKELAVYRKIAEWPVGVLDQLIAVLDKFQTYQTMDSTARGTMVKIRRRDANTMSTAMFRQLGNCLPDFFKKNHVRVLTNEASLKEILSESDEANDIGKSEKKVVLCAVGSENIESLKSKFPEKFSHEIVKQFTKAEISGKKRNILGMRLKNYVKSVQQGTSFEEPVKFETFQAWSDINISKLEGHDVIVLNVCKENFELVKCWIDYMCCSTKEFYSVLVILESETYLKDIYKSLDTYKDKPEFKINLCMFKQEKSAENSENVNENVVFSVLFGKVNIFKGPVMSMNDVINKDLLKVVNKVTPPSGKVAYISRGDKKVVKIHTDGPSGTEASNVQVTYFVTEGELAKIHQQPSDSVKVVKSMVKSYITNVNNANDGEIVDEEEYSDTEDDEEETDGENVDDEEVEEFNVTQNDGENSDITKQPSTSSTIYS
jgi:hypothetical protein